MAWPASQGPGGKAGPAPPGSVVAVPSGSPGGLESSPESSPESSAPPDSSVDDGPGGSLEGSSPSPEASTGSSAQAKSEAVAIAKAVIVMDFVVLPLRDIAQL